MYVSNLIESDAVPSVTIRKKKDLKERKEIKIPNLVASYDHAMGTAGTILTPYLQGSCNLKGLIH